MTDPVPADACPYERPFADDFDACPAYQPSQYVGLDMSYRPMAAQWTCSHLEAAAVEPEARFYARCRLGDAVARLLWVDQVRAERIGRLRELNMLFTAELRTPLARLWEAKARHLQASRSGADLEDATTALDAAARDLLAGSTSFLEKHLDLLEELELPLDACLELVDTLVRRWVEQPALETPEVPPEVVARFPAPVRALIRPDAA